MFDFLRRRRDRENLLKLQEEKMRLALEHVDKVTAEQKEINGHTMEQLEAEIEEAADDAVSILEEALNAGT